MLFSMHVKFKKTVASLVRNNRGASLDPENAVFHDSRSTLDREIPFFDTTNSLKSEMCRAWSTQSADLSDLDFKGASIYFFCSLIHK